MYELYSRKVVYTTDEFVTRKVDLACTPVLVRVCRDKFEGQQFENPQEIPEHFTPYATI